MQHESAGPVVLPQLAGQAPKWLVDVCRKHRPMASIPSHDLVCLGCDRGRGRVSWTPEHLARMIQKKLDEALNIILEG